MTASTVAVEEVLERPLRGGALRTFGAMMAREVRVLRRQFITFIARTLLQPLLTVFVFSYILPKVGGGPMAAGAAKGGGAEFSTVLVPGMIGMSIMMTGMMSVLFPLMMELGWTKEITDRLLAPLPTWALALQKVAAGAIQALIAGVVVFPIVFFVHAPGHAPDIHVHNWFLLIAVMLIASVASPAMGLFLGTLVDPQKMMQLFGFVLMPAAMLGCIYYPWEALRSIKWLQYLVLINPFVYASEGLRAVLTPNLPHMSAWAFVPVLLGSMLVFCYLAARTFTKRVLD
jgi:ABC-2 type transport system permease protein